MASILFKWFLPLWLNFFAPAPGVHPFYVSVVEIEHNAKDKTLEISCKIFTDDFEKALRQAYPGSIDLLHPKDKAKMNRLVNDYVQKHLQIAVDGKTAAIRFLGYEQIEEGIYSYYQADNIASAREILVKDNILYEYKTEQLGIIHVTVNGNRKSTRLINPAAEAVFRF